MRNWIIATLIVGTICFVIAGKVSKSVKEFRINSNQEIVNNYSELLNELKNN